MDRNDFRHLERQQIEENMKDILVIDTKLRTLEQSLKEKEKNMEKIEVKLESGFKTLNNRIIGGMGLVIMMLIGVLLGVFFGK